MTAMTDADKNARYERVAKEIASVIEGENHPITRMATISCLLSQAFDHYYWTGFYLVDPDSPQELIVGPYQGTLGCLRIPFSRSVCGAAARTRKTQIGPNVNAIDDHVACDALSQSEIVVPVIDRSGQLIAVFDVDSTALDSFNDVDGAWLESILSRAFS